MKTTRGIYLNLEESEYKVNYLGLLFYFSSVFYKEKFINNVENYVSNEELKLKTKYNVDINFELMLAIAYYRKIEKRGFFIKDLEGNIVTRNIKVINTILSY